MKQGKQTKQVKLLPSKYKVSAMGFHEKKCQKPKKKISHLLTSYNTNFYFRILFFFKIGDADMEKGADTRTLSAEIFENCRNCLIVEDYAPLFSEENLFLVEMFDKTFNIWHIYSL